MATYPSPTLQNLTVNGTATLTDVSSAAATITGGTIDGTPIGATTPAAVHATTINSTGAATLASVSTASATLTGGTVDGVTIGGTTPEAVHATDLSASGTVSGTGFTNLLSPYPTNTTLAASGGSALVGFLQAGTGAVARNSQSKMQDEITLEDFGAVGDGVTDDHAAIVAAISAYPNATIKALGKTYRSSSVISLSSSVRIVGEGIGNTKFLFDQGSNGFNILGNTNRLCLERLCVYANGTPRQNGVHGIASTATSLSSGVGYLYIRDVEIYGFDHGIHMQYCQLGHICDCHAYGCNSGYYSIYCVNMKVSGSTFELNNISGIYLDGNSGSISSSAGTLITGCQCVSNGSSAGQNFYCYANENFEVSDCMFDVPATGSVLNVTVDTTSRASMSNSWVGASNGSGVKVNGCTSCKFIGLDVVGSSGFGFEVNASTSTVISANSCTSNGNLDIYIYGGSLKTVVCGNDLNSTAASYSVQDSGTVYSAVTGNTTSKPLLLDASSLSTGNLTH